MHIQGFHVEKFGVLQDIQLENLPPVVIFLGRNEAGKSTLLEFFRATLTGYPKSRKAEAKIYLAAPQDGGTLVLKEGDSVMRLTRHFANRGGLVSLFDAQGNVLALQNFDRLMHGVDRDLYCAVYGFGLGELQSMSTLQDDAVRNALYGASFGLGLQAPQDIIKSFDNTKLELFRPSGQKHQFKALMDACEDIDQQIKTLSENTAQYDAITQDLALRKVLVDTLRVDRQALELERRSLERRLSAWDQWEQWRSLGLQLERIPTVAENFPVDARIRMEHSCQSLIKAEQSVHTFALRCTQVREALKACQPDTTLLSFAPTLHGLHEHKQSLRTALDSLPNLRRRQGQYDATLQSHLATLGAGWNVEIIQAHAAAYQDIGQGERFELRANALNEALAQQDTHAVLVEKCEQECREALRSLEDAKAHADSLPIPEIELDASSVSMLQAGVMQCHEAQAQQASRQEALRLAIAQYTQAITQWGMTPDAVSGAFFDTILSNQAKLSALASTVMQSLDSTKKSERIFDEAKAECSHVRSYVDALQEEGVSLQGVDRHTLEAQRAALHGLRTRYHTLSVEQERLRALEAQVHADDAKQASLFYRSAGLWLGIAMLLAGFTFVNTHQNIELFAPLSGWHGWLAVLCGGLVAGVSIVRSLAQLQRQGLRTRQDMEQCETLRATIMVLETECHALCEQAGLGFGVEPIMRQKDGTFASQVERGSEAQELVARLHHHETALAREQERCTSFDHWQARRRSQQERLQSLEQQQLFCEGNLSKDQQRLSTAQQAWHELLQILQSDSYVEPETLDTFLARCESIRLQANTLEHLEQELVVLRARIEIFLSQARPLLVYHACILEEEKLSPLALLAKVDDMLAMNHTCEQGKIERTQAIETVRMAQQTVERTGVRQAQAQGAFDAAARQYADAASAWQAHLLRLNVDTSFSPPAARQALEHIQKILHILEEKNQCLVNITQHEDTVTQLATSLETICTSVNLLPIMMGNAPDWLASLDMLLHNLDEARTQQEQASKLAERLRDTEAEHAQALHSVQSFTAEREALLTLAQVDSQEIFLQHEAYKTERDALTTKRYAVEDALRSQAEFADISTISMGSMASPDFAADISSDANGIDVPAVTNISSGTNGIDVPAVVSDSLVLAVSDVAKREKFERFMAAFESLERDSLILQAELLGEQLQSLQEQYEQEGQAAHLQEDTLRKLRGSTHLAELRAKRSVLCEQATQLARTWARYAMAQHLFLEAKKRFEQEQQPDVMKQASSLLAEITGGVWTQIIASLDDASLQVMAPSGSPKSTEILSRGTQEQVYLALRLAHIRNHAAQASALPIITDDILVNFDANRMERTIQVLSTMTQEALDPATGVHFDGHQIIFFTCHEHVANTIQSLIPNSALHVLEGGKLVS